ncbi:hypothetical protein SAMN05216428_10187 [Nitrosospira sp. Nsp11]|uniref:hypothetical protein n=1 Tax=Nitrosospira sp. Nsp11 TaxID=1855338 RepID=UPI0009195ACF|nr:hypothetical protein [Nitrosospira sp. Nsp11]SHL10524.1 hypothetical protein SAMN05216428_10187 [Nitrosospira sp. Nsp11]
MSKKQSPVGEINHAPISGPITPDPATPGPITPDPATPDPATPDPNTPDPEQPKPEKTPLPTKARVLIDVTVAGKLHCSGTLLQADAEVIASLGDQVDTHPEAVAYCEKTNNV